ncbi:hypothetical protein [Mesorhizobium sp.]|nr:hypothetical protein [Mesorhizobium sp.]
MTIKFVAAACALGCSVADEKAFLRSLQNRLFGRASAAITEAP